MGSALIGVGALHFIAPKPFIAIVPEELPAKGFLVYATGVLEVAGGVQLIRRPTRRLGWMLTALLLVVFPANVNMAVREVDAGGPMAVPRWAAWARLPFQFLMIWAVLRATRAPAADPTAS